MYYIKARLIPNWNIIIEMIANVQIEILVNVQNELSNLRLYFMGGDALRECTSQCENAKFWAINLNWVIGIICKYRFGS